jgi:hypothetical protein
MRQLYQACVVEENHPFCRPVTREKAAIRKQISTEWENTWQRSMKGGHLRRVDGALPATRTRRLYGSLPRNRAYLLTQLRTGHSWLATHSKEREHREVINVNAGRQKR